MNKIRSLDNSEAKRGIHNMTQTHRKDKSNFVIFKRRKTNVSTRRFNENQFNTIQKKRMSLHTQNRFRRDLSNIRDLNASHEIPRMQSKPRLKSAAERKSFNFGLQDKSEGLGKTKPEIDLTEDEMELFQLLEEKIKQASEGDKEAEEKALKRLEYLKKFFKKENTQILMETKIKMIKELVNSFFAKK